MATCRKMVIPNIEQVRIANFNTCYSFREFPFHAIVINNYQFFNKSL